MTDLAAKIRHMRDERGLKQAAFAKLFNTTQATVSRWESGSQPEPVHLVALAEMAGQTVSEFLSGDVRPMGRAGGGEGIIMLPVSLPSHDRLAEMMASLLDTVGLPQLVGDYAERLAQLLPDGLAQAAAPLAGRASGGSNQGASSPRPLAKSDPGSR